MTNDCAPDAGELCAYPPCFEPAVVVLTRPLVGDQIALCREHGERGKAMIAWVAAGNEPTREHPHHG